MTGVISFSGPQAAVKIQPPVPSLDAGDWLSLIGREQLDHGEFPTYRLTERVRLGYLVSPLLSAYVHDALRGLDRAAFGFDPLSVELGRHGRRVAQAAGEIRRAIRGFLSWQEDGFGASRLYGRTSPLPADLDTTACVSLALSDQAFTSSVAQQRRAECVTRLASVEPSALSTVALVNALRCQVRLGRQPLARLQAALERRVREHDADDPVHSAGYATSEVVLYAFGRLYAEQRTALSAECWQAVLGVLQAHAQASDTFQGLEASLTLSALIDFELQTPEVAALAERVRAAEAESGGLPFQRFFAEDCGSPALCTAFGLGALMHAQARGPACR